MGNLINLNKARKAKARKSAKIVASENVAKHGRSGTQKKHDKAEIASFKAHIDAHKRDE